MAGMHGTWYVVPTPFTDDGRLDLDSQRRIVEAAIEWGVDGLTVLGVMSEVSSLLDDERRQILDTVLRTVDQRVPVAVGCSAPAAAIVRDNVNRAAERGAAAAMISAPPLIRNVDTLPGFFASIGDDRLEVVVQDEPAATGVLVPNSVLLACVRSAGAKTVKLEDPPTPPKISALLSLDNNLQVFGGLGGVSALAELGRGACGTMTGFAFPEVLRALRTALDHGDHARAGHIFDTFLPLIQFEAQPVVGLAIRKEVLRRRGVIACNLTRGLSARIDQTTARELSDVLSRVGIAPSSERFEVTV